MRRSNAPAGAGQRGETGGERARGECVVLGEGVWGEPGHRRGGIVHAYRGPGRNDADVPRDRCGFGHDAGRRRRARYQRTGDDPHDHGHGIRGDGGAEETSRQGQHRTSPEEKAIRQW